MSMPFFRMDGSDKKKTIDNFKNLNTNFTQPFTEWRGPRTGLAAVNDSALLMEKQNARDLKYGMGGYKFQMIDNDGKTVINTPLPFGSKGKERMFYPNSNGIFNVLDSGKLKEEHALYLEQQKYINDVCKLCLASDEQCKTILGLIDINDLSSGTTPIRIGSISYDVKTATSAYKLPDEILNANAIPSILNELPVDSLMFSFGVAKLKKVIQMSAPIIDDCDDDKVDIGDMKEADI